MATMDNGVNAEQEKDKRLGFPPFRALSGSAGVELVSPLHHQAAARIAAGMMPALSTLVAALVLDAVSVLCPGRRSPAAATWALVATRVSLYLTCAAAFALLLSVLRAGGPTATLRLAYGTAVMLVFPAANDVLVKLRLVPHLACPGAGGSVASCEDMSFFRLSVPSATLNLALSGLPSRVAFSVLLGNMVVRAITGMCLAAAEPGGLDSEWATRLAAKSAAVIALGTVLLRAALGADEPPELAQVHLCPAVLHPLRDALLAVGDRCARWRLLRHMLLAVLLGALAQFVLFYGAVLLQLYPASTPAHQTANEAIVAVWAVSMVGIVARVARLQAQRVARHARQAEDRRVHALHLCLSALDDGADAEATLTVAAHELLRAFPPGCSVGLAEWTIEADGQEPPSQRSRRSSTGLCQLSVKSAGDASKRVHLQRVFASSPRPAAEEAMRSAVRRGCSRRGSAFEALGRSNARAGLTLDSEDFLEGADAYADWSTLVTYSCAGAGTVSTSLVGCGAAVVGGLWVHSPVGVCAPSPAALREYADCIGAVLLRNSSHRAALRAAAAEARADADATLALQRSFLSGITHELRTPLNAVVGFTSTVLEGAQLTPTDAEYLRCSMTAANTLLGIIDQLLDYSKWHRDSVDEHRAQRGSCSALASAPMRICTVLDELVDVVGGRVTSKGASLRVEATAGVQAARLCGDAPRLRQVLVNLSENAIKFVRPGGTVAVVAALCAVPRLSSVAGFGLPSGSNTGRVSTARTSTSRLQGNALSATTIEPHDADDVDKDAPQQWLHISVADNGIGIPPEDHWRLFKPFSQIQQQTAPGLKPVGTGLGLAISRAIIREMGGDVVFDSLPGVGTTFTITVPFCRDLDADNSAEADEAESALAGVTVLPLLRDVAMGASLARMAASWGATTIALEAGTFPRDADAELNAAALSSAVDAVVEDPARRDAPLLVLADAAALAALLQAGALRLPRGVCCVLSATPAEHAAARKLDAGAASSAAPPEPLRLDLPTSPGRLFARLRAAVAVASAPPLAPDTPRAPAVEPPSPLAPPLGAAALRVLLAEDNAMNAAVARAVLARCGVKAPHIVGDGEAAVAAFRESLAPGGQPWSLILLDMQMPRLDGPGAARAIRSLEAADESRAPVLIVAVTANSSEEDRRDCITAGMNSVMVKPITPAAMRAALAPLLEAAKDTREL